MKVILFDTETVGIRTQTLLNVGYKIVDINPATAEAQTLCVRSYLDRALYNDKLFMLNDAFVGADKLAKYNILINEDKIILRSMRQVFATMVNDIAKYGVMFGYAYNCAFDTDKFAKTAVAEEIENPLANLPILDIWGYASNLICQTSEYKQWAKDNEQYTKTEKFVATSVEAVTRFLERNNDFVEEHTALSDVEWELKILQECIKRGADITQPMKRDSYIKSGKVFTKRMILPDGKIVTFDYTDSKTTADGFEQYIL